jgi:hypothetical protein
MQESMDTKGRLSRFFSAGVVVVATFALANYPLCCYCWSSSPPSLSSPKISRTLSPSSSSSSPVIKESLSCSEEEPLSTKRRHFLLSTSVLFATTTILFGPQQFCYATDEEAAAAAATTTTTTTTTSLYTRQQSPNKQQQVSYSINLPSTMKETSKPVKTHLDEVNFVSETTKGYQYGVTVDPVRISSLKEVRRVLLYS